MAYTNRKGITYYLCRGQSKTGKARYSFARAPQEPPVTELPAGYTISESVNGVVSLVRERPSLITAAEAALVEAAVRRHPQAHRYRVAVKHKEIAVYEQWGPDAQELTALFAEELPYPSTTLAAQMHDVVARTAQYTVVARFLLEDVAARTFKAERAFTSGPSEEWLGVGWGPLAELARNVVPTLGPLRLSDVLP